MYLVLLALAAAIVDLVAAAHGWETVRTASKPMPALLLAVAVLGTRGAPRAIAFGLLLAAAGDELLLRTSDAAFIAGMGAFALMHVCYIAAFARMGTGRGLVRRLPWLAVPYAGALAGTDALLWPKAGTFALPVAAYGLLLAAMAVTALDAAGRIEDQRAARLIAGGALVFMASDTLLAFAKFWPQFPLSGVPAELTIVGTYFIAQLAIAGGAMLATVTPSRTY